MPASEAFELAAALALARRRRIGPFRDLAAKNGAAKKGAAENEEMEKELAILARAGFGLTVATEALRMDPEEAEALLSGLREP